MIILDDELTNTDIDDHPNEIEQSCVVLDDTVINNNAAQENRRGADVEIENNSLFFIDNVPNAKFKTPLYSVEKVNGHPIKPIAEMTPMHNYRVQSQTKMSAQNINNNDNFSSARPSQERCDSLVHETEFQPDPQLSSTQFEIVPDLLDDSINTQESVLTLNSSTNDNSENVTSVRTMTCSAEQLDNTSPIKRKALGENQSDEPATKRTKDVVVIEEEYVSDDDDDAVVFVSETLNFDRPSTVGLLSNRVCAHCGFIRFGLDNRISCNIFDYFRQKNGLTELKNMHQSLNVQP